MNCFMLKAISTDNSWVTFYINDIPTPISEDRFVLLRRPNSPILMLDGIRRGDPKYGLFEGDIIEYQSTQYLICYERGFYAINRDYVVRLFDELNGFKLLGTVNDMEIDIPISFKKTLLFKYKHTVFKINDIIGESNGGLLINSLAEPINPDLVRQDCCIVCNKQRMYLGDNIHGNPIELIDGRLQVKQATGEYRSIEEVV